jgi:hypothetical protein
MYVTYTCATKMQVISSVAYSDSQSVSVSASCQCAIGLFDVTVTPEKAHSQVLVSQKNSSSSGAALDPPVWIIPNKALSLSLSLSLSFSLSLSLSLFPPPCRFRERRPGTCDRVSDSESFLRGRRPRPPVMDDF